MLKYLLAAGLTLLFAGCAAAPAKRDPRDPLERMNRSIYSFNMALDRAVTKPIATGYKRVTPAPIRRGISNFLDNLAYPRTIVNELLQGKVADSGRDCVRLVVNTVFGLGFFDPAGRAGLEQHDEDFGQTLGKWGVPSGPYLMLPFLGPSTVRDGLGEFPDEYTTGRHYLPTAPERYGVLAVDVIDTRAQLLDNDQLIAQSYDPYAFVRNAWLQRRAYLVNDGTTPDDDADADADQDADAP
ncbi:MAG: VacJ family lipoprotein [Steroidobacteraceae bacterium]